MIISKNPTIDLYNVDCLNILKDIKDKSIDLLCSDPPYGTRSDGGLGNDYKWISIKQLPEEWIKEYANRKNL